MRYKVNENIFFKVISDKHVLLSFPLNDEAHINLFGLEAEVFLMIIEQDATFKMMRESLIESSGKNEKEIDTFLTEFLKAMVENKFFYEVRRPDERPTQSFT